MLEHGVFSLFMEHYFYDDDTALVDNHITHSHARHTQHTHHCPPCFFCHQPASAVVSGRHSVSSIPNNNGLLPHGNSTTNQPRARTRATITNPIYQRDDDFHELHHQKRKAYGSYYLARKEATIGVEDLIKRRGKLGKGGGGRKSAPLPGVAGGVSTNYFCTKHHFGYTIGGGRLA